MPTWNQSDVASEEDQPMQNGHLPNQNTMAIYEKIKHTPTYIVHDFIPLLLFYLIERMD